MAQQKLDRNLTPASAGLPLSFRKAVSSRVTLTRGEAAFFFPGRVTARTGAASIARQARAVGSLASLTGRRAQLWAHGAAVARRLVKPEAGVQFPVGPSFSQGGGKASHGAHNPAKVGSIPTPATIRRSVPGTSAPVWLGAGALTSSTQETEEVPSAALVGDTLGHHLPRSGRARPGFDFPRANGLELAGFVNFPIHQISPELAASLAPGWGRA